MKIELEDMLVARWALRASAQDAVRDYLRYKVGRTSQRVHAAPSLRMAKNFGRALNRISRAADAELAQLRCGGDATLITEAAR